jgi:hypothetical protein
MSVEPTGYCAFNIKKVKGYSDSNFNLVCWLSELYAVKCGGVARSKFLKIYHFKLFLSFLILFI